ncbi:hypothetical protein ACFDTO_16390 [Microbacteriaceae bacterium 4G12]
MFQNSFNQVNNKKHSLHSLIGSYVQLNLGGPEKREGILLKVYGDYCALYSDEDVLYYQLQHIKSYTQPIEDEDEDEEQEELPMTIPGKRFVDILDRLKGQDIQINRGGPQKVEGTITGRNRDFLLLEADEELLHIPIFHIQNISWICSDEDEDEDDDEYEDEYEDDDEDDDENNEHDQNQSSGRHKSTGKNKSSGKRSYRTRT